MNIDKFGHHVHKRLRLTDLFDFTDHPLTLKKYENDELNSSILKNVQTPKDSNDAVNKEYIDTITKNLCNKEEVNFILNEFMKEVQRVLDRFIKDVYTKFEVDNIISSLSKDEATSSKRNS